MPVISIFFGIIIRMFHDDHPPPHFHAEYGEYSAVIDIGTGRMLGGRLPPRVARLVEEWRGARVRQLQRAWDDAQHGKQPKRIPPLA
jgi:hypothetical protein